MSRHSAIRSAFKQVVPSSIWQTAGFLTRVPSYWRIDRSEALRIQNDIPGLPLHVTKSLYVFSPESITAFFCWRHHGVEVNESSVEVADFLELAENCNALVDIGAQTGFISAVFARSRPGPCQILSVEPDPRVLPILERAKMLNKSRSCDWTIAAAAVSDRSGLISLPPFTRIYEDGSDLDPATLPHFEARASTLAELVAERTWKPDIIKIDVESFEHEILTSSLDLIGRIRPALQLEVHWKLLAVRGRNASDFLRPLADLGYVGIRKRYGSYDKWVRAGEVEGVSRLALKAR